MKMKMFLGAILAFAAAIGICAGPGEAATVTGEVVIASRLNERPTATKRRFSLPPGASVYRSKPRRATRQEDQVQNVVVYLEGNVDGGEKAGVKRISQKDQEFRPFVLPVRVGSTVEFPNDDVVYHSVYSESPARKFELPEYPRGESRSVTFDAPGVVKLFCAIHPRMNAYILVLGTGFFAMPGKDHTYRLEGVPPGRYRLTAWHPLLESVTKNVVVDQSGSLRVDFTL